MLFRSNGGPLLPLDFDGSLSIPGSSLRMNFTFGGRTLNVNASWFQTQTISDVSDESGVANDSLSSQLFKAARRVLESTSAPQSEGSGLSGALRSVGDALKQ